MRNPVAVWTGVRHLLDLGGGQRHDLAVLAFGQGDAVARRRTDQLVADGRLEGGGDPPVDDLPRPRGQHLAATFHPRLDLAPSDGPERAVAEEGVGVETEVALGLGGGGGAVDLAEPPLLGVVTEGDEATGRVDVPSVGEVAPDGVEEELGLLLAAELLRLLGSSGVIAPARPVVTVLSSIDACHVPLRSLCTTCCTSSLEPRIRPRNVLKRPQVLKKSSEFEDFGGHQRTLTDTGGQLKVQVDAYKWQSSGWW